jgi:hypothetical protein
MNRQATVLIGSLCMLFASCSTDSDDVSKVVGWVGHNLRHYCPQPPDTGTPPPQTIQYQSVTFPCNGNMATVIQPGNGNLYPTGHQILGAIPFDIPASGPNFWFAQIAAPAPTSSCSVTIPVDKAGVAEVHTLMNTYWGKPDGNYYAYVEFFGSEGAYQKVPLYANDNIRDFDYLDMPYANDINGTTTIKVFDNEIGQRLDKQVFVLPEEFRAQALSKIVLTDIGAYEMQRIFCAGVTVGYYQ